MVVREAATVDARRGYAVDVARMHAVVDLLVAPVVLAGSDARLEIDDAQIHAGTIAANLLIQDWEERQATATGKLP